MRAALAARVGALLHDSAALSRAALLPGRLLAALVLGGAVLGLLASALAVSRHLRRP